jgi:hypothetical protein
MTSGPTEPTEHVSILLETIYKVLRSEDQWPPYGYLEEFLALQYDINIDEVRVELPYRATRLPPPSYAAAPQQPVELTIEGLRLVRDRDAAFDAEIFFRTFRRFLEQQKNIVVTVQAQPKPCLTVFDLQQEWGIRSETMKRVFRVVALEPWVAGVDQIGNAADAKGLDLRICADNKTLRKFKTAMTLDDYIELRQPFFPRPPQSPLEDAIRRAGEVTDQVVDAMVKTQSKEKGATRSGDKEWDVFIAHSTTDQEPFVRELAEGLETAGFTVWYAPFALKWGDSLRRKIEEGLTKSRYGIVVLSPNFFASEWPQSELDGLTQRQNAEGRTLILPILHNITIDEVRKRSPMLADRLAISSDRGVNYFVQQLRTLMS